jgi:hypothetical protein
MDEIEVFPSPFLENAEYLSEADWECLTSQMESIYRETAVPFSLMEEKTAVIGKLDGR